MECCEQKCKWQRLVLDPQSLRFDPYLSTSMLNHSQLSQSQQQPSLTVVSLAPTRYCSYSLTTEKLRVGPGTPMQGSPIVILGHHQTRKHACNTGLVCTASSLETQQIAIEHCQLHKLAIIAYTTRSVPFSIPPFHFIFQFSNQRHPQVAKYWVQVASHFVLPITDC